jgi:hypothetical protein
MTLRPHSLCLYVCTLALLLLAVGGCTPTKRPAQLREEKKPPKTTKTELPGHLTGKKWHIPWYTRDPKNPSGRMIPVLIADAEEGEIVNTSSATLLLSEVHAQMFHNGDKSATIDAPHVTTNQSDWIFVGTGGVTVRSLTDPPDTVIYGDKVTWNMKTKILVAEGHARITQTANGKVNTVFTNRITFDTALKELKGEE